MLRHLPLETEQAVDCVHHVHGYADGSCLIGNRSTDSLADPPGCVGGELVSFRVVELLDCPQKADAPLLDQIQEGNAPPDVVFGYIHHEAQVGLNKQLLCLSRHDHGSSPVVGYLFIGRERKLDVAQCWELLAPVPLIPHLVQQGLRQ